jgi:hypothetical protein
MAQNSTKLKATNKPKQTVLQKKKGLKSITPKKDMLLKHSNLRKKVTAQINRRNEHSLASKVRGASGRLNILHGEMKRAELERKKLEKAKAGKKSS